MDGRQRCRKSNSGGLVEQFCWLLVKTNAPGSFECCKRLG